MPLLPGQEIYIYVCPEDFSRQWQTISLKLNQENYKHNFPVDFLEQEAGNKLEAELGDLYA